MGKDSLRLPSWRKPEPSRSSNCYMPDGSSGAREKGQSWTKRAGKQIQADWGGALRAANVCTPSARWPLAGRHPYFFHSPGWKHGLHGRGSGHQYGGLSQLHRRNPASHLVSGRHCGDGQPYRAQKRANLGFDQSQGSTGTLSTPFSPDLNPSKRCGTRSRTSCAASRPEPMTSCTPRSSQPSPKSLQVVRFMRLCNNLKCSKRRTRV